MFLVKKMKSLSNAHLYRLMGVTVVLALIAVPILWSLHLYAGVAAVLLFSATFVVQAGCIDPPGLEHDIYEDTEPKSSDDSRPE